MTALVTGGAGYIGAHVVDALHRGGQSVVIVDDFSTGLRRRVPDGVPLIELDLAEPATAEPLQEFLTRHGVDAIIHLAARKQVGESVELPERYLGDNLGGLATVVTAMRAADVRHLVFSSSASVYGEPTVDRVTEDTPTLPVSPYGASKLAGEWLTAAAAASLGGRAASLRYFNVAGAGSPRLGDTAVLNLVPMVFERLEAGVAPRIFGADYDTPDGTCVRDFVHVADLAEAHVAVLEALRADPDGPAHEVYNIGTGVGGSVREVIDAILRVSGVDATPEITARRPGDPARVVAEPGRIAAHIGWRARRGLDEIVDSAWRAWQARD